MFIVLNGPLGIGKSTLAEALTESVAQCVLLGGDHLVAANPAATNELEHLHSTIALLVKHHRQFGYRHFVIEHIWRSRDELEDLRRRLLQIESDADIRCFLLTLSREENLQRIEKRRQARAVDEREFELQTVEAERELLANRMDLGEPFDVSGSPEELVGVLMRRLGLSPAS
jgi:thymidylate kinase